MRQELYLEDLYVTPQARRLGIGRKLLRALATEAQEKKCGRMEWAVLDWNQDAIAFYQSLGADVMEDWRICRLNAGGIDALARP